MPTQRMKKPDLKFPKGFLWGSAISAYQTEGGNNNQWYVWEREGGHIKDGSVCGRADDFYHLYEKDLDLAQELGHKVFRFSVEWSRIEPQKGEWNPKEVEHYRDVLKAIRKRGIEPFITLHHKSALDGERRRLGQPELGRLFQELHCILGAWARRLG